MIPVNWSRNEILEIDGEDFRVESRARTGEVNLKHIRDNRSVVWTDEDLMDKWDRGELRRIPQVRSRNKEQITELFDKDISCFSDSEKKEMFRRAEYVREYDARKPRKRTEKVLQPLIDAVADKIEDPNKPSWRQLARWIAVWRDVGCPNLRDPRSLVPLHYLKGNRVKPFHPEVEEVIEDVIDQKWLIPNRETVDGLHKLILYRTSGIPTVGCDPHYLESDGSLRVPSKRTIYRRIENYVNEEARAIGQLGQNYADAHCKPVLLGPQAEYPLEQIEIDHTLLDVIVVDEESGLPLGRPWITVALDRFSRMILGFHLSFKPPGVVVTMQCLRKAIRPKSWLKEDYPEIINEWPCFGRPRLIVVDNAPEFHSESFKDACRLLNITIMYCPARTPRYKGKIERWFGRLARQYIHTLPGTTFSNPKQRGTYDSEANAIMSLADLKRGLLMWIVDEYSRSHHRGIDAVPADKWAEGIKRVGANPPLQLADLNVLLSNVQNRVLSRKGVTINGLTYCNDSPQLKRLINHPDRPETVKIRVDVEDVGHVFVWDWISKKMMEIPCIDQSYAKGLTLDIHGIITARAQDGLKKYQRAKMSDFIRTKVKLHEQHERLQKSHKFDRKWIRISRSIDDAEEREASIASRPMNGRVAAQLGSYTAHVDADERRQPTWGLSSKAENTAATGSFDCLDDEEALLQRAAQSGFRTWVSD